MDKYDFPTQIDIPFGDGLYRFFFPMPTINEFERKHGSFLAAEYHLCTAIGFDEKRKPVFVGGSDVKADLCRDVLRLGLIGGSKAMVNEEIQEIGPQRARELVETYAYPARPLEETALLAWQVLTAAVYGRKKIFGQEPIDE